MKHAIKNRKREDGRKCRTSCTGCRHYYVTWQPAYPHGCRGYGFKSRRPPCDVVHESSGMECSLYKPKRRA